MKITWLNTANILYWLPRILGIFFIAFLGLFALDMFTPGQSILSMLIGFLIHLIPNFILTLVLLIAWKRERIGGFIFIFVSILFTVFFKTYKEPFSLIFISFPILIIGILFLVHSIYFTDEKGKLS